MWTTDNKNYDSFSLHGNHVVRYSLPAWIPKIKKVMLWKGKDLLFLLWWGVTKIAVTLLRGHFYKSGTNFSFVKWSLLKLFDRVCLLQPRSIKFRQWEVKICHTFGAECQIQTLLKNLAFWWNSSYVASILKCLDAFESRIYIERSNLTH